jgi:Ca2+-binding RTX toxin-like protein
MRTNRIRPVLVCLVAGALTLVPSGSANAAIDSGVSFGFLYVNGTEGPDTISVSCVGGQVRVNGTDPDTGPYTCEDLEQISVKGRGGPDGIDLAGVSDRDVPLLDLARVQGGEGDDVIEGSGAPDLLVGQEGFDVIDGGPGRDVLQPGPGGGRVDGGLGRATLGLEGGSWAISRSVARRVAPTALTVPFQRIRTLKIVGGPGADRLNTRRFPGSTELRGEGGDDEIRTGPGEDLINGSGGTDLVSTGRGEDRLFGGPGDDVLRAGRGDDDLSGGLGTDACDGGPGQNDIRDCE